MNIFVFDIETVPDVGNLRAIYNLATELTDNEVVSAVTTLRRQENLSEFLPLHLHRIVAISAVLQTSELVKVWSLGTESSTEQELIERFFAGIEKYKPILVSWNGSGFDLPVLHYRALLHGVTASRYWENGDTEANFRYNNYLSRYHYRHTDLMDIMAGYQQRANAPLDHLAIMLGFPGKMGMHGSKVWEYFQRNELTAIRNYCETDVLNTYLVYLRFELIRGHLTQQQYEEKCTNLRKYLASENRSHWEEFLSLWPTSQNTP